MNKHKFDQDNLLSIFNWASHKAAYKPFFSNNTEWLPSSATLPLSIKIILSASTIVDNLCAITKLVEFSEISLNADKIACSEWLSSDEVASSKIRIGGFLIIVKSKAFV